MGTDAGNIGGKQKAVSSISKITTIQTISIPENKRILAISDIHGEDTYLDGALKKANYTCDDILVIVGDIIEKGRESLRTVRYIMALQEDAETIFVLNTTIANTATAISTVCQLMKEPITAIQTTHFPPLNPKYRGNA